MQDTINVRIKMMPGNPPRPATTKVFLDRKKLGKNARALEPGEIIALPKSMAEELLNHLPYELEMTLEEANRPLAFASQHEAAITSTQNSMINRSELIKASHQAEVAKVREEMKARNDLMAREEAIAKREAELGINQPASEAAPKFTMDDEEVREPRNNMLSPDELEALRKGEEETAIEQAQAESPKRKRGRPRKNPQPETAA